MPIRLLDAPILKYAGTKAIDGNTYDLVFATWKTIQPHKENDQYLLYIHKETGVLTFANYTVRGVPSFIAPKNIYGSIQYDDFQKNEDEILYPSKLYIFTNKLKKKKKALHTLSVYDLMLNSFDISVLYPDTTIEFLGDKKVKD